MSCADDQVAWSILLGAPKRMCEGESDANQTLILSVPFTSRASGNRPMSARLSPRWDATLREICWICEELEPLLSSGLGRVLS